MSSLQSTSLLHNIKQAQVLASSPPTSLAGLLLAQARHRATDIAVRDDTASLSYCDLVSQAAGVALNLREAGVDAGGRVGLFVESSVEMMTGLWGILLSGGAYLPLGTDYPVERLTYMIRDAGIKVIVTQEKLRAKLAEMILPRVTVVELDALELPSDGKEFFAPELAGTDLAYMIYTSGTTGAPKGVGISQAAILNQLAWLRDCQQVGAGEVILQKTPASFDAAQWELLAVCSGAEVVMGRPGVYRDPPALIEQIRRHGVTMLQGVPTLLQALVDIPEFAQCTTLTSLFSGGEALTRKLSARIFETRPGCRLVNLYGPTECTINATSFTVDPAALGAAPDMVPIGLPVAGTRCYVLNESLVEVKDGETGELYIGGSQVAEGYHDRADLTAQRFIHWIDRATGKPERLYKSGDLVYRQPDGVLVFQGRADNQVKFRGYRIELDEIRVAIENHDWVKSAGVFIKPHPRTQQPMIAAGIELNPREAQLMDQGNAGSHHRSKKSRLQVRAQLSDRGLRSDEELSGRPMIALPGAEATPAQRALAFARKTYRFFEGGETILEDLLGVLSSPKYPVGKTGALDDLTEEGLGHLLRYFGQFTSPERLLPKLAYASPGALYATQVYLEVAGLAGLEPGYYYYNPTRHELVRTGVRKPSNTSVMRLHFVGKVNAIEPVYKNNIREVLEFETGHILGLLDHVLPAYGLGVGDGHFEPAAIANLDCAAGHVHLAAFDIVAGDQRQSDLNVDYYVQAHGHRIKGLSQGHYVYRDGELVPFSSHLVEPRHVIAINQRVYERASGMISIVSRDAETWRDYIDLGRALQRIQQNERGIGAMSSGYSSKSGNDLAAAVRLRDILGERGVSAAACYSAVFGKISEAQRVHEGMHEDSVHMEGPAELIRQDLQANLPDYMVPSKIALIANMPQSASGKVDVNALKSFPEFHDSDADRELVKPRNETELRLAKLWGEELGVEDLSIRDDFFEIGGDSLQAVQLVLSINKTLGVDLPVQVLFEASTVADLAVRLDTERAQRTVSRAVTLKKGQGKPIFCWPGLGGYPMNLRHLANTLDTPRPFVGVQALGVNPGEDICQSIHEMACRDAALIRNSQPEGPYTLWGYSFGARVAYETAWHLEQAGEEVVELILIAPGSPQLPGGDPTRGNVEGLFRDPSFLTILYSVFAQTIAADRVAPVIAKVRNEKSFVDFIADEKPELDAGIIARITRLVAQTYTPGYGLEMKERELSAPTRLFKARGDNLSFLEQAVGVLQSAADVVALSPDHYQLLKQGGVDELVHAIRRQAPAWQSVDPQLGVEEA
ncbi:amino acid adenylation domain-containing protein (plasmid) [Rhizobium sp. CB3171]|uniref:amino acid adenylation domain-containing protein n=1 Tax=Rhizobium sp. CB3171 TaxID=3039157 RepID=UPI0024B0E719|nr:amino acid adenylation domain-containing protein [Rhizobium sp. CB3171]WFU07208.1 amino acid adenylation domain-containing protein [Rhizobium sp. CB3171]